MRNLAKKEIKSGMGDVSKQVDESVDVFYPPVPELDEKVEPSTIYEEVKVKDADDIYGLTDEE